MKHSMAVEISWRWTAHILAKFDKEWYNINRFGVILAKLGILRRSR